MNPIDLIAILLIVLAVVLGFRSGALPQVGGLVGAIGGGALAVMALPSLAGPLGEVDPVIRPFLVLAGLLAAVGIGESVGSALGRRMARALGDGVLDATDRVAGGVVGGLQAVLIIWLAGGILAIGAVPRLTEAAAESTAVRTIDAWLPPPTRLAAGLEDLLGAYGLPEVFVGFDPLPQPPVDRPSDAATRRIAARAEASTVKISAATCNLASSGSGVVVADRYVVTNAHVVAGADPTGIRVSSAAGEQADAVVVLFDPDLDVALLSLDRRLGEPARFAQDDPERGTVGAALGYPGGGGLTVIPAAVTGTYRAIGHDIYGENSVPRQIIELRAAIDRGDSGGPLILEDGTIGGLVFAEARTDANVGYALAPTAVAAAIRPGLTRTKAVDTGSCLR